MTTATVSAPRPVLVYCHGPTGVGCPNRNRHPIAEIRPDGTVVVVHDGREHDVTGRSTTCPRCKTRREFRASDRVIEP